jgi:hypothetical protein
VIFYPCGSISKLAILPLLIHQLITIANDVSGVLKYYENPEVILSIWQHFRISDIAIIDTLWLMMPVVY